MAENRGKQFESIIREQFDAVPNVSVTRLHDQTTGFKGSSNKCDFIFYRYPNQFEIECKSVHGASLAFANITDTQWNELLKDSKVPGVIAGILVWFIDKDKTYFIPIHYLQFVRDKTGKKSINYKDCENGLCHELKGKKKRVFFDYDVVGFLDSFDLYKLLN